MVHPNHPDLPKRQTAAPATTAKKKDAQPEIRANNLPEKVSMGKVDDLLEKGWAPPSSEMHQIGWSVHIIQ